MSIAYYYQVWGIFTSRVEAWACTHCLLVQEMPIRDTYRKIIIPNEYTSPISVAMPFFHVAPTKQCMIEKVPDTHRETIRPVIYSTKYAVVVRKLVQKCGILLPNLRNSQKPCGRGWMWACGLGKMKRRIEYPKSPIVQYEVVPVGAYIFCIFKNPLSQSDRSDLQKRLRVRGSSSLTWF